MMSLLATKSGVIPRALAKSCTVNILGAGQIQVAHKSMRDIVDNWKKANDLFYGPDRDMKNFPTIKQRAESPKIRHDFIPDDWFKALYPKTGASGPYIFIVGLSGFLLSKEYLVYDEVLQGAGIMVLLYIYMKRKYADRIVKSFHETSKKDIEGRFYAPMQEFKNNCLDKIKESEKAIWYCGSQPYFFEAEKENVALQLEAEYRKRVKSVHDAVKRRLDYQVDVVNTKKQFEQEHMVNWILDGVLKGITPQQEKESINACLQTLKGLAAQAK